MSLPTQGTLTCPLCDWTIDIPAPQQVAPGLADVFGMSPNGLAELHQHQMMRRTEADIDRHMGKHKVAEWLPALMDAKRRAGDAV